jgi:hypothetical protein
MAPRRDGSYGPPVTRRWSAAGAAAAVLLGWLPMAAASGWPHGAFAWAGETVVEALESAEFRVVLAEGLVPEGGGGLPVLHLGLPSLDASGRPAFTGRLDDGAGGDGFVWLDGRVIWRNSAAQEVGLVGAAPPLGLGDGGQFLYRALVEGKDVLWSQEGLVARAGQPEPLLGGATINLLRRPLLSADGRAYWLAFYRGTGGPGRALFTRSPEGETAVRLRSGDAVNGGVIAQGRGLDLAYDVSSDGAHHAHIVTLDGGGSQAVGAVLLDGEVVLRTGDESGAEESWERFRNVAVSSRGHWLLGGETSGASTTDTVLASDGEVVLREGDRLADVELAPQAAVVAVDIDDRGRVAHLWSTGGFGRQYVLFSCSVDSLRESKVVLKTRPPVYIEGRETVTAFEGTGHGSALRLGGGDFLYAWVRLTRPDGQSRQAVVATRLPACPEPSVPDATHPEQASPDGTGREQVGLEGLSPTAGRRG